MRKFLEIIIIVNNNNQWLNIKLLSYLLISKSICLFIILFFEGEVINILAELEIIGFSPGQLRCADFKLRSSRHRVQTVLRSSISFTMSTGLCWGQSRPKHRDSSNFPLVPWLRICGPIHSRPQRCVCQKYCLLTYRPEILIPTMVGEGTEQGPLSLVGTTE